MVTLLRDRHGLFRSPGPIFCPLLGVEVAVSVFTDGGEVHPDQLDALTRFLAIEPQVRTALFEPLFANYQAMIEAIGEGPEIDGVGAVWAFVRWTNLIVPRQSVGRRFVFVQGDPFGSRSMGSSCCSGTNN